LEKIVPWHVFYFLRIALKKFFQDINGFFSESHGVDTSFYDEVFLQKTIGKRMNSTRTDSPDAYFEILQSVPGEAEEFLASLQNGFSEFFRQPFTFACLEKVVFPRLLCDDPSRRLKEIRIWSAACSAGQEVYSLAILLDEMASAFSQGVNFRIFASDRNEEELQLARKGVYPASSLGNVTLKRIETCFTLKEGKYSLSPRIKKNVEFSVFDLLTDPRSCPAASIYGNFHLVFCCNLLFYYKEEFRKYIIGKAGNCLAPGGYLVTGESERDLVAGSGYREVIPHSGIFMKK
jgi:chemotaxis protein methyltransferase CheR